MEKSGFAKRVTKQDWAAGGSDAVSPVIVSSQEKKESDKAEEGQANVGQMRNVSIRISSELFDRLDKFNKEGAKRHESKNAIVGMALDAELKKRGY